MKTPLLPNIALIILGVFAFQRLAAAHAFLDHSEPKVGSDVPTAPTEVKIWLTQAVEPAFSKIQVFAPDGSQIDKKDTHVDKDDHHLLIVSLPALGAGTYKVEWKVVSVDTHRTQGDFKFTVK